MSTLFPWWLGILSGVSSSVHCVGMCGPFVLLLMGPANTPWRRILQHILYTAGRLTVYAVLGAVAGAAGQWSVRASGMLLIPAVLGTLSAVFLIREGLALGGIWPYAMRGALPAGCMLVGWFRPWLRQTGPYAALFVGMSSALLPCALLYAMLASAAGTGHVLPAIELMLLFGLGTVPALVCLPWIGTAILARWRLLAWRVAGMALVAAGSVALWRSAPVFLAALWPGSHAAFGCH